ncbi:hypothetical protein C4J98_4128 [Pseudomonas orientalis]|nr:hypothetical protein C4J98_4128 [Pseudomonas orientalis]
MVQAFRCLERVQAGNPFASRRIHREAVSIQRYAGRLN